MYLKKMKIARARMVEITTTNNAIILTRSRSCASVKVFHVQQIEQQV